jgi:hypothetical protein
MAGLRLVALDVELPEHHAAGRELVERRGLGARARGERADPIGAQRVHHPEHDVARRRARRGHRRVGTVQRDPRAGQRRAGAVPDRELEPHRATRERREIDPRTRAGHQPAGERAVAGPGADLDPARRIAPDITDEVRTDRDHDVPRERRTARERHRVGRGIERRRGARIVGPAALGDPQPREPDLGAAPGLERDQVLADLPPARSHRDLDRLPPRDERDARPVARLAAVDLHPEGARLAHVDPHHDPGRADLGLDQGDLERRQARADRPELAVDRRRERPPRCRQPEPVVAGDPAGRGVDHQITVDQPVRHQPVVRQRPHPVLDPPGGGVDRDRDHAVRCTGP